MIARDPLQPLPLDAIQLAATRIAGTVVRTPLIRLHVDAPAELWLKVETLQPIGSFKIRGALNAVRSLTPEQLARGVYTTSAGNMAQGLAWAAREAGVACRVFAPDHAPKTKIEAMQRLGATPVLLPYADWWRGMCEHGIDGEAGTFVHPGADAAVMAGNATIGLEIVEDLPDVDVILVPYGCGGLSCAIASAVRALRPDVRVYAVELEGRAPFAAALAAGHPVEIDYTPSFVDGMGGKRVLDEMWPVARELLAGSLQVTLEQVAAALRLTAERTRLITEGAGASTVAAALAHAETLGAKRIACVLSGGNIDTVKLMVLLGGGIPA